MFPWTGEHKSNPPRLSTTREPPPCWAGLENIKSLPGSGVLRPPWGGGESKRTSPWGAIRYHVIVTLSVTYFRGFQMLTLSFYVHGVFIHDTWFCSCRLSKENNVKGYVRYVSRLAARVVKRDWPPCGPYICPWHFHFSSVIYSSSESVI